MMLVCKRCGKSQHHDRFSEHEGCKSGYDISRCKDCKKSVHDWKQVSYEKRIFNRAKVRAKKKGLAFTIELEDIVIPTRCPVFGKKFIYGHTDWTYSIDRINPKLGYIKGNVAIISNKANRSKNDASIEELEAIIEYMRGYEVGLG